MSFESTHTGGTINPNETARKAGARRAGDGAAHDESAPVKFKGKYRIPSARRPSWDYGSNATYFVTICTKNRVPYFGTIDDAAVERAPDDPNDSTRMHTTPLGEEARRCWSAIPVHFPFVRLDAFVIMPDHVHGIVVIDKSDAVETHDHASLHIHPTNHFGRQSRNLASIIRGFKIGVTTFARVHDLDFAWQARYHDRIVREDDSLGMIRFYIQANPMRWLNTEKSDDDNLSFSSD